MKTEKTTNSQNVDTNPKTSLQFGISIALGVLTILLVSGAYYLGLVRF